MFVKIQHAKIKLSYMVECIYHQDKAKPNSICEQHRLTLYSIIEPFDAFEISSI